MAWNGSGNEDSNGLNKGCAKRQRLCSWRGLIVGLTVVLLGCAAVCLFFGTEVPRDNNDKQPCPVKASGVIAEVNPSAAQTNAIEDTNAKPKRRTSLGTEIPDGVTQDEKGIYRYSNGQRWVDRASLKFPEKKQRRMLFKHPSENRIAGMLKLDPSRMMPHLIGKRKPFDKKFADDFKASLDDTLVIDKEDTPEEAELRKAVLETKADLKQRMDAGEDIVKIMNDTQGELDRLCQYNHELKQLVRKAVSNPEMTDDEVKDYVAAANAMLEKQGLKPIAMPSFHARKMRLQVQEQRRKRDGK